MTPFDFKTRARELSGRIGALGYDLAMKNTKPIESDLHEVYRAGQEEMQERCAKRATNFLVGDPKIGVPLRSPMPHEISEAIRALPIEPKEPSND